VVTGVKEELTVSTDESFESILKASMFVDKTLLIKKVFQPPSEENDETDITNIQK
jgi:hypothetical protein